jgi:serine/threonine protein kinase
MKSAASDDRRGPERPSRIGRYRVVELLGEGGMGRVFLAEDEALRRRVALKVLKRSDEESRRRFVREARAAARVSHPNLCPIFDVGEEDGQPFLAMELLAGETLAARIRTGPLAPAETLRLAEDLLAGLAALHETGIVHRDVKPSNFFLTPHGGRLVDFGLASEPRAEANPVIGSTPEVTSPGQLHGTPGYMAPEQILGHTADARTDLFAAGAMLYEALTGRRPFPGTQAAALSATLYDEPEPLAGSPELVALDPPIRRALAKKGAQRFASAPEMAEALRRAAGLDQREDTSPTHLSPGHLGNARTVRRWAALGAAVIAAVVTWLVAERTPPPPLGPSLPRSSSEAAPTTAPAPSDGGSKAAATAGTAISSSKTHGPAPIPSPVGQASPVGTGVSSPETPPAPAAAPPAPDEKSSTLAVQALVHALANPTLRGQALEELVRLGKPAAPALVEALGSEDPAIREAAAEALAGIGIHVGTLKLRIRPWANVSVDGRAVGTTPLRALTLVAGDHAVRLEHPLFDPLVLTTVVRAGLTTELDVDLRRDAVRRAQ